MQRHTVRLPLHAVDSPRFLTRSNLVQLAHARIAGGEAALCFAVASLHEGDGEDIVHAEIELLRSAAGDWSLTYVSHPARCDGLTEQVLPSPRDFETFVEAREWPLGEGVTPICADGLEAEGVGPLAVLDLRRGNRFPVVPSMGDRLQLLDLMREAC